MNKTEIGAAVDTLIGIKDRVSVTVQQREAINNICNLVDHNINNLSNDHRVIMPAEFIHKQRVGLKPVEHHYEKSGEKPYIKYGCPICEAIVRDFEPDEADEGTFNRFSFAKGTPKCPCCGVNFAWEEEVELKDNTDKCKNTECNNNTGFTATCMYGDHHMNCRKL